MLLLANRCLHENGKKYLCNNKKCTSSLLQQKQRTLKLQKNQPICNKAKQKR